MASGNNDFNVAALLDECNTMKDLLPENFKGARKEVLTFINNLK